MRPSNYGPIDYINFDGWSTWPTTPTFDDVPYGEIFRTVKAIQPECLIVNHCYESNLAHADVPFADAAGRRYPYHPDYMRPTAASDTSQMGWWWDDNEDYGVRRSVDCILKQLHSYNSHNSVYVLNLSPGPDGRIPEDAIRRVTDAAKAWEKPTPLAKAVDNWGFQYDVTNNLAFLRPCSQSTTHKYIRDKRAYPRADIAVDGVTEGDGTMEQTSITENEKSPWWQVDLERDCLVRRISIYDRTDMEAGAGQKLEVTISTSDESVVWNRKTTFGANRPTTLDLDSVIGRKVRIRLDGAGSLSIAEVIIEGTSPSF